MIALMGIYVGAVYGGSYGSIMIQYPWDGRGRPRQRWEGYPMACRGEAGRALGPYD